MRIVRVTGEIFEQMLTEGTTFPNRDGKVLRVTKGLPGGATLVGLSHDLYFGTNEWALKVAHPDWPDVPPGCAIPELRVEFSLCDPEPDPCVVVGG